MTKYVVIAPIIYKIKTKLLKYKKCYPIHTVYPKLQSNANSPHEKTGERTFNCRENNFNCNKNIILN